MAPHQFYYRYNDIHAGYWYPWQHVDLDIPSYDVEKDDGGKIDLSENGTYLIPVVFNNRLLVFFPQFRRKSATKPTGNDSFKTVGDQKVSDHQNIQYWEIALAWSEYRNGTWLQKQVCTGTLTDTAASGSTVLPNISQYEFVPRIASDQTKINIDAYSNTTGIGGFTFSSSQLFTATETVKTLDIDTTHFHNLIPIPPPTVVALGYFVPQLHCIQGVGTTKPEFAAKDIAPYFADLNTDVTAFPVPKQNTTSVPAADKLAHQLVGALAAGGVDGLYAYYTNLPTSTSWSTSSPMCTAPPRRAIRNTTNSRCPYALYHWEIGFHAITLLVDRLTRRRTVRPCAADLHRVLNPFAAETAADPVWRFAPFRETDPRHDLEKLFLR